MLQPLPLSHSRTPLPSPPSPTSPPSPLSLHIHSRRIYWPVHALDPSPALTAPRRRHQAAHDALLDEETALLRAQSQAAAAAAATAVTAATAAAAREAEVAQALAEEREQRLTELRPTVEATAAALRLEAARAIVSEAKAAAAAADADPDAADADAAGAAAAAPAAAALAATMAKPDALLAPAMVSWAEGLQLEGLVALVAEGREGLQGMEGLDLQPGKGWLRSNEGEELLRRLEHIFAHAESMQLRMLRLRAQGRGKHRPELRALTAVRGSNSFAEVRAARKELEATVAQRKLRDADSEVADHAAENH